jgi:hypothetical protein
MTTVAVWSRAVSLRVGGESRWKNTDEADEDEEEDEDEEDQGGG